MPGAFERVMAWEEGLRFSMDNDILKSDYVEAAMNVQSMRDLLEETKRYEEALTGVEMEDMGEDNLEESPYSPDDIRISQRVYSIYQIEHMIYEKKLILTPEFQRNLVWDIGRMSLLIESIMLGIPIASFYFQEDYAGDKLVIDGLQRLSTIHAFMSNDFRLKGLQYLKEYDGCYYSDLPKKYVSRIEDSQLVAYVLDSSCHELIKFDVFRRVNTGGVPLNSQEIRNTMAAPGTRHLLDTMSHSEEFICATRGKVKDIRMDAQELCLRFIAFYMRYDFESGTLNNLSSLTKMLDQTLLELNHMKEDIRQKLLETFKKSMERCYALLGEKAFSKKTANHIINKPLFTSWSVILAGYDRDIDFFRQRQSKAIRLQQEYFDDGKYFNAITSSTATVRSMLMQFEGVRAIMEEL